MPDALTLLIQKALTEGIKPQIDPNLLSQQLGPQTTSGAFGTMTPEMLLGLDPEDITNIANTRATGAYQRAMTNMGALDFVRKATGAEPNEKLTSTIIEEEQKHRNKLAELKEHGKWATSAGDPIRAMVAGWMKEKASGKVLEPWKEQAIEKFQNLDVSANDKLMAEIISQHTAYKQALATAQTTDELKEIEQSADFKWPLAKSVSPEAVERGKKRLVKRLFGDLEENRSEEEKKLFKEVKKMKQYSILTDEQIWEVIDSLKKK